jgi:hypothetical protein
VTAKSATVLSIQWTPPVSTNGHIQYYLVSYREVRIGDCPSVSGQWSPLTDIDADRMEMELTDLFPYSVYEAKVWAQTVAGRGQMAIGTGVTDSAGGLILTLTFCILNTD